MSPVRRLVCGAAVALLPIAAPAHDLGDRYGPLLGALLHPLTALDHLLALVALGLLAGQQRGRGMRVALAALLVALPAGVVAGMHGLLAGPLAPLLGHANLVSVPLFGTLVALARPLPAAAAGALAALAGLSHGGENGLDLGTHASTIAAALGVAVAGAVAAVPPALLGSRLPSGWPRMAARVAGSWIAAIGLIMLALAPRAV